MSRTKKIADDLSVCSFVTPDELPALAGQFATLINNRPDAEEPGQTPSAEIERTARELGMNYVHIPVVPGQVSDEQVAAFARALGEHPDAKLAFCRTGMRAATLWALAKAGTKDADEIVAAAQEAGYDLSALKPRL
jgi:sulfide:quinone oxidoreductase